MIMIIFEVWPLDEHRQAYLDTAARLKNELEHIEGFISVERFESLTEPGKILSLSCFENEAAVTRWRNTREHRKAQAMGRNIYFDNYRLRVVKTVRDYTKAERGEVPDDSRVAHP